LGVNANPKAPRKPQKATSHTLQLLSATTSSHIFQLLITEFKGLLYLILQLVSLTDIKPCLLCQGRGGIKVSSSLKLFQKSCIVPELSKQGCELLF
jgi:hypothetical protein